MKLIPPPHAAHLFLLISLIASAPAIIAQDTAKKSKKFTARLLLKNGDQLSGLPLSLDKKQHILFESESLRQTASFPLTNILSFELNSWKHHPTSKTTAHVILHPRFSETSGDTILGDLHELTPENIKLKTWYGGIITLKRSMVKSLNILSNTPGNYHGPNNIKEWTLSDDDNSWEFKRGKLTSLGRTSIGKDMKLREKSHISFDAEWSTSMRFKCLLYSSDVGKTNPDACYEVNINRSSAYLRTRGKVKGRMLGGGRWQQLTHRPKKNHAHFDFFINRKTGSITIYIDGNRACMLLSQAPDPSNLGTGISFIPQPKIQLKISAIHITPWNGTTLPTTTHKIEPDNKDKDSPDEKKAPPHRIILNNGDEVPGTVGKVQDGSMIVHTQFTPIHIPIAKIKSISLGNAGEEPRKYQGDIRAWFHTGGFVTLKLTSLDNQKITGSAQAMGEVSLKLSAFRRIDFHIYDPKANHARELTR